MTTSKRDADEATGRIRITAVPEGEAPEWVRREWVGVTLPALPYMVLAGGQVRSVLSGEQLSSSDVGYIVPQKAALMALAVNRVGAAAWWHTNGFPRTEAEQDYFFFASTEAEIVSGVNPTVRPVEVATDMETGVMELPGR